VLNQVVDELKQGNLSGALDIIDSYVTRMANVLPQVFVATAQEELDQIRNRAIDIGSLDISFDPGAPAASALMEENRLDFITDFTRAHKLVGRVPTEALDDGDNPLTAARKFQNVIGLTEGQSDAVDSYRDALESGSGMLHVQYRTTETIAYSLFDLFHRNRTAIKASDSPTDWSVIQILGNWPGTGPQAATI
jgi:hypothetical protein